MWEKGRLVRALSLASDDGVIEDIGSRLAFEDKYWAGQHLEEGQEPEDGSIPFDPLDLGEGALKDRFGYQLEGEIDGSLLEPESISLLRFKRSRQRWWKFW